MIFFKNFKTLHELTVLFALSIPNFMIWFTIVNFTISSNIKCPMEAFLAPTGALGVKILSVCPSFCLSVRDIML